MKLNRTLLFGQRHARFSLLFGFALLLVIVAGKLAGIKILLGDSMPAGIWIKQAQTDYQAGAIVEFCPGREETFQVASGGICFGGFAPVLKPIGAVAGDRVDVARCRVSVNGVLVPNSARITLPAGRMTVIAEGHYLVREGEVWLLSSHHAQSLDSRYYGAVQIERLGFAFRPLLLFASLGLRD